MTKKNEDLKKAPHPEPIKEGGEEEIRESSQGSLMLLQSFGPVLS